MLNSHFLRIWTFLCVMVIWILVSIFWITFDRNKIESCGFHHYKEQMKMHRIASYRFFDRLYMRFPVDLFKNKSIPGGVCDEIWIIRCTFKPPIKELQTANGWDEYYVSWSNFWYNFLAISVRNACFCAISFSHKKKIFLWKSESLCKKSDPWKRLKN